MTCCNLCRKRVWFWQSGIESRFGYTHFECFYDEMTRISNRQILEAIEQAIREHPELLEETMTTVEVNERFVKAKDTFRSPGGSRLILTPPLDENYWIYRVKLKHDQAIVAFPKFGLIGCGFAIEEDWNTNLPLDCPAEEIYNHIKHNKQYEDISKAECISAIEAIQGVIQIQSAGDSPLATGLKP